MKEVCHVGYICFPNIENKAVLKEAGVEETELKVERFTFICPVNHPSIFGRLVPNPSPQSEIQSPENRDHP